MENLFCGQTSRALRHRNSTSRAKEINQIVFFGTKSLNKQNVTESRIGKGAATLRRPLNSCQIRSAGLLENLACAYPATEIGEIKRRAVAVGFLN